MKRAFAVAAALIVFSTSAMAERVSDLNGRHVQVFPHRGRAAKPGGGSPFNLSYHNGPVLHQAKVVPVFWGSSATWGTNGSPSPLAQAVINFFEQFGNTGEYNVIVNQYYDGTGSVQAGQLTTTYWIDNSAPPTNVTDAALQGEVVKAIGLGVPDASTVYEVFLPPTSYASFGSYTSCGGPNLTFCAYHANFSSGGADVKYASMPYPSCGGCRWSGWTDAQNFEHFACHETREAATDPDGTAWFDRQGNEADDKCAWSPSPFLDGGYGYQYEWSNLAGGCVQTR